MSIHMVCRSLFNYSSLTLIYPVFIPEHAMAWECSAKLPLPPAKPALTLPAHSAKPITLQRERCPSLGACPEQLALVSVLRSAGGPPAW
ncbi:hypothetical protein MC885_007212 [Smutsia gigantea]|nr:hypothetical protein MC885_007212 [Smutsia gigantea]